MSRLTKQHLTRINHIITMALIVLSGYFIFIWFQVTPKIELDLRLASPKNALANNLALQKVNIKGTWLQFQGLPGNPSGAWPNFRGTNYNNIAAAASNLRHDFSTDNLPLRWEQSLGEGYAGAAVTAGRVYVLDYIKNKQSDALRCFSLDTGEEIWQRSYVIAIKRNHGISRTVPAVADGHVVTIGPKCQVMCVAAESGAFKWGLDLPTRYQTEVPLWYTGQCPFIENGIAVMAPGGRALLIGVELSTGRVVWETPNPDRFKMSHASPIPMTIHGKRMAVYPAIGGLVGVSLSGPDQGQLLWMTKEWNHSVISPSAVQVGQDKLLVSAGYGGGSMLFKLDKSGNKFTINKLATFDKSHFACEQHTPIYYRNHLFTILPNDAGAYHRQLVCMAPDGRIKWRSGRNHRFGLGPFVIADGKFFILDDHGMLTIAKAGTDQYEQLNQIQALSGRESWAPIAIAGSKMILRDFTRMICLDLTSKGTVHRTPATKVD